MSSSTRRAVFLPAAAVVAAVLVWGVTGLPGFGHYRGPYGLVLNDVAVRERHMTNVVTAVVFDYQGFDTLGEEFILFTSVIAVALLLRSVREEQTKGVRERVSGEAWRAGGLVLVGPVVVLGLYVVAHGPITPGGGFQGGVVLMPPGSATSGSALILVAGIVANGAILRATGRVFAGWGSRRDPLLSPEPDEGDREAQEEPSRVMMLVPAAALALAGFGLGLALGLEPLVEHFAQRFQDQPGYIATVLHHGRTNGPLSSLALPTFSISSVLYGVGATVGAAVLAQVALDRAPLAEVVRRTTKHVLGSGIEALRAAHSGHIGDYVAWLTVGLAAFGVAFSVALR